MAREAGNELLARCLQVESVMHWMGLNGLAFWIGGTYRTDRHFMDRWTATSERLERWLLSHW